MDENRPVTAADLDVLRVELHELAWKTAAYQALVNTNVAFMAMGRDITDPDVRKLILDIVQRCQGVASALPTSFRKADVSH